MRLDAEKKGPALYAGGKDKRLTKIGKFCTNIILTNYLQLWNVFVEICLLSDLVLNVNFILTKLWNETLAIGFCIRFVLGVTSYATLYNGYTDTIEKKCYVVCDMTYFIYSIVHGGLISRY